MADESGGGGGIGDAFFIIGIFILLFFVWVATGGPSKPIATGGFTITSPKPISTGEARGTGALLGYRAPSTPRVNTRSSSGGEDSETEERRRQTEAENELTSLERSVYRGDVTLVRSTSGAKKTDAREEYLKLKVSSRAENPINISNWKLVSEVTGKSEVIPFGTELPLSGIITEREALYLDPGDDAYVISGRSPIGASFRINMCMGYFAQYQSFTPTLRKSCPLPEDELRNFSSIDLNREVLCEEFVEDIPRCSIATSIPPTVSGSCKGFVETNISYNGCVSNHKNDEKFFDDEWRVYLGRSGELWKKERETIRLYDSVGKLVDQISY
tara:strand:- start:32475 stop:33461 length:987 start_codon:yes stop_codon:yes gene_type:complete